MPDFTESLQGRDLGHLQIIAELWGIELKEQDPRAALVQLTSMIVGTSQVEALVNNLSSTEKEALAELAHHSGRLPWAQFTREYGEVREMGVAKRDREQPFKQPISAAESLWYHGIIAKAFFDTPVGAEEFAYIPDDLLGHIPHTADEDISRMGRQASTAEYAQAYLASDRILDHACTLLAAIRMGITPPGSFFTQSGEELTPVILKAILAITGIIDQNGRPLADPVRRSLEASRAEALMKLFQTWKNSNQFNELRLIPNLILEGNWVNDPLRGRQAVLDFLSGIPAEKWWSVASFIAAVKQRNPDYQRPAGDYDSWFIRNALTGEFLRGFDHWDTVDGRLVKFILTGPLYWLGVLDLGSPETSKEVTAFRLSRWSRALLKGEHPKGIPLEVETILVRSDARISVKRLVPRRVRYQLARFCEWGKETPDEYQYQISSASLSKARKQGLTVSQLLTLLNRNAKVLPPNLVKALERWEKTGSEARVEKLVILRVTSADVLNSLRNSRAGRFLGEPLGPNTIAIKSGATQKVLGALAELGFLGEVREDVEGS
jgi:predicted transcriptional regulator